MNVEFFTLNINYQHNSTIYINAIQIKFVQLREIRESHPANRDKRNHTRGVYEFSRIESSTRGECIRGRRSTKEGNQRIGGGKIRKQRIPIINRSPVEKWTEGVERGKKKGERKGKEGREKRKHGSSISTSWILR